MKKTNFLLSVFLLTIFFIPSGADAETRLRMSSTTSIEDSGLLRVLLPPFEKKNDVKVDVIAVGTGQALKLGENGDVDVVFVHSKEDEEAFVKSGKGVNRKEVMYNDFIIAGPDSDPAGIKEGDAVQAFKKIAGGKAAFFSRGDDSGTNKKEKKIWVLAGIKPEGDWYRETGQGMGATLLIAAEKNGYTLSDRGTYLASGGKTGLSILSEKGESLLNQYGIIAVNPERHPHVRHDLALKLADWVTSPEGQKIIGDYRKDGMQLFHPGLPVMETR